MTRFSDAFLDELRARLSIVDVIGARVPWDQKKSAPARGDYWACCPFHGEKTPSFHVVEKKGFFHCFGCHEQGSMFDFVMKLDRLSFPEAVEALAEQAGLPLPAPDPQTAARDKARARLTDVTEAAVSLFRAALEGPDGAEARAYLERRGLSRETIEHFELGLAAGPRDGLIRRLTAKGATLQQLFDADLAAPSSYGGGAYDRFQNRLMFPIRDSRGRCVAFGGRDLTGSAKAKYMNSSETELFSKKRALYNIGGARAALAARSAPGERPARLVVAEGYMDVIALHQAGFAAAVAPLGTAVTEDQLALFWRLDPEPTLALDGDAAGLRAADRVAERALPLIAPGRSLQFALLPAGQDPDDFLRADPPAGGAEAFAALLERATPLVQRLFEREAAAGPVDTPERRADLDRRLAGLAARIVDQGLRRHYTYAFRNMSFERFRQNRGGPKGWSGGQVGRGGGAVAPTAEARAASIAGAGGDVREAVLVLTLLNHPSLIALFEPELSALNLSSQRLDSFLIALLSAVGVHATDENVDIAHEIDARLGVGACKELEDRFARRLPTSAQPDASPEAAEASVRDVLTLLMGEAVRRREIEEYLAADAEDGSALAQDRLRAAIFEDERRRAEGRAELMGDENELSSRMKEFVDAKPWIKRRQRSG